MTNEANQKMNNAPGGTATSAAKRRRNRKKKNKNKKSESQKEAERQKELEFSKMNNHAKLRSDLIANGFSAEQIDAAMDEMWNQNMPYDEYDHVYKYLKEGKKKPPPASSAAEPTTTTNKGGIQKIAEDDDGGVEETKEEDFVELTPSQVVTKAVASTSPKRNQTTKSNLNSMAARLDMVAGFDNLADAIFAMTEWIIQAAKPNELEELCASVETIALSKIIRRSITESTSQAQFDSTILPSMVRLLENLLQKCGMPASDKSGSFPSILRQARKVYQMKKAGSEGVPQRVAEFMVARMYVILKESRISNQQQSGLDVLQTPPNQAANAREAASKKGFAAMYSERESHHIVAKQFGAAALASCRAIASSTNSGVTSSEAMEAAKTDIFSAIIDEDTNAAFHQHEFMYTELKAQVSQEESKEEQNQSFLTLKTEFDTVQTKRNELAEKIAELQKKIGEIEAKDKELVGKQFKIQEEMDHESGQQSDETKKLNDALTEAKIQLQSNESVRSLVDLLKDFEDALAERSVQAISQGNSPEENASKSMDFYLQRAKNYFESEANLFQLLQKRIVTNQTKVSEMKRDIEMCQGLGMTTTINQMEEDIKSTETMVARDKSLVSRIRTDSAAMLDEMMVWLEEYHTAQEKDPNRLVPISDKIVQAIPTEISKLEVPNGDRLDAFLAIYDIIAFQPPTLSLDLSETAEEEDSPEEPKKESVPKFTWVKSPTNEATGKKKKSLLDIQKEELEFKKEEEEKAEKAAAVAAAAKEMQDNKVTPDETAKEENELEMDKTDEHDKAAEPEDTVTNPEGTKPDEEQQKEVEIAGTPSEVTGPSTTTASDAKPEETKAKEEQPPKEAESAGPTPSEPSTTTEEPEAPSAPAGPVSSPIEGNSTEAPAANDDETRDPLLFPCFLAPPTGTTLSMPFAPFRKEDEGTDNINRYEPGEEPQETETATTPSETTGQTTIGESDAVKPINEKTEDEHKPQKEAATAAATATPSEPNTTTSEPACPSVEPLSSPKGGIATEAPAGADDETRDPLVFPCYLAPPTGTTLSMPFAPFRKEDEFALFRKEDEGFEIDLGDYVEEPKTGETSRTMSTEEELNTRIAELGEQIKKAKQENTPKEEWDPVLKEMLALKAKFKEVTGKDHGPPKKEKKQKNSGQQEASEKNKEKRAAKAAAKAKKEAEKAAKRAERERREREKADKLAGVGQDNFGDAKMVQSQEITDKKYVEVANLNPALAGQMVLTRGYLQISRGVGKGVFVLIRSTLHTVQGVAFQNKTISQGMVKYVAALPVESVVEVEGIVTVPDNPVESATQKMVEIQITSFRCVSKAKQALPFLMEDACRPDEKKESDVGAYDETEEVKREDGLVRVGDKNRLDNRWLDLRTPANQSIMRIESMVGCLFRECLLSKGFIELHSPKLIAGSSEGGADVFTLDYFGQPACLAMSPQLHKQMAAACSGFERVFTTGPVFRAENSNTRRHLCEFTGFDMEMAIHEHYDEVMNVFSDLFIHIFDGINVRCKAELERIREQHPFEDLKYLRPTLKITYAEGCALLREAGIEQDDYEDLSTENEKKLGDIVKEKYDTDFFFMDKYPLSVRPFYTMPCPENPKLSNSYDFFIRGQEILSGAQRIHEPDFIEERAKAWGIDLSTIEEYVNSFRNGALPHGGGGIGLERVVMLFLGLPNIRKAAWFPRDPRRLAP